MKTLAALAVGAMALLGLASTANAQAGWYVSPEGAAVIMQDPTTDVTFGNPRNTPAFRTLTAPSLTRPSRALR